MGTWRIERRERALDFGQYDNTLFQQDAGHSYQALLDENGAVVATIDGNAFTPANGGLAKGEQTVVGILSAAANEMRLSWAFNKAAKWLGYDLDQPRFRISMDEGPDKHATPDTISKTLIEGSEEHIRTLWTAGVQAGTLINEADTFYQGLGFNQFGQNCHTWTSFFERFILGLTAEERPAYSFYSPGSSPGSIQTLLEKIPTLSAYDPTPLIDLDLRELKIAYNDAKFELEDSITSPALLEQIATRNAQEVLQESKWAFGYGITGYTQG